MKSKTNTTEVMWGFGLTETQQRQIEGAMGPGYSLRNLPQSDLTTVSEDSDQPSTAWIPRKVWEEISENRKGALKDLESVQRILIQDENENPVEIEEVLEEGFLTVVRSPLTRTKVQDAIFRAKEVTGLYTDIFRMTEELLLERELLKRKTDQLVFLNKMVTDAAGSLDIRTILQTAQENFEILFPVRILMCAMRNENGHACSSNERCADVFIPGYTEREMRDRWLSVLIESSERVGFDRLENYEVSHLGEDKENFSTLVPEESKVMAFPLQSGIDVFGCLVLASEKNVRFGKDQVQTLNAAVNHLGLALRNAMRFSKVKSQADRDGLTGVFNRRSFDERLSEELSRYHRYGNDLSLFMVDLDHFKVVNDTYGHKAGDMVLRTVAEIFKDTLRITDFTARYGGEEFALILPHTDEDGGLRIAHRLRRRIESHEFVTPDGQEFQITASIGVATLRASHKDNIDIVSKADAALYSAKLSGRNMVVIAEHQPNTVSRAS
ncbi:MAG: GGDEF domain-containing protein [Desulfovibrio sp.]